MKVTTAPSTPFCMHSANPFLIEFKIGIFYFISLRLNNASGSKKNFGECKETCGYFVFSEIFLTNIVLYSIRIPSTIC